MFQAFVFRNGYKIVDPDFGDNVIGVETMPLPIDLATMVIEAYEKRGLNVAANLALSFKWRKKWKNETIDQMIGWNKQLNPIYNKYADDIEKYLLLI